MVAFEKQPFKQCLQQDENLAALRAEYARRPADERRMAADWEYHSSIAGRMFSEAAAHTGETGLPEQRWPEGLLSLAIDPLFAPAILTVGSLEYQLGRRDDTMDLFLTLTTLPAGEPDLSAIIDKAGNFLLDKHDYSRARDLYAEAGRIFPDVAAYPTGLGYCLGKLGMTEAALAAARRANDLEPGNYVHVNDLGWALYQAGQLDEALMTLRRAVGLSPCKNDLASNNLRQVQDAIRKSRRHHSRFGQQTEGRS